MPRHPTAAAGRRLLTMFLAVAVLSVFVFAAAAAAAAEMVEAAVVEDAPSPHILPRPLVIELPTSTSSSLSSPALTSSAEVVDDDVPVEVRCASWRLAGEANNLAPWKSLPPECAAYVRDYLTGVAYRSDLELVAREASAYAHSTAAGDARDAWVFDVDETLLSNLPYYADHGYGLELFDHREFDKWVERGEAPAIPSSLKLYNEVRELGFKTFLLTGRSEGHEGVTVDNLNKQGFHDWDKLILRAPADRKKTATIYKSEKRKEMEEEGYRILGNSGDQWSDLLGFSTSARSFKLPNPMYYIP
uniref:Acid phosphatase n=1 Tax=Leersia perrieri TaxID=77586 RepID=A0A0D9WLK9_9ORYZ